MGPIDYSVDIQSPFQAGLQGFAAGDAIRGQMDARAQAEQAAIQKQQQAQQLQELLGGIANNPNATADDYARVMTLRPDLSEKLQKAWSTKSEAQQKGELSFRGQVFTALNSNQPEVAADMLKKRAEAKRAQGMEEEAAQDEMVANTIAQNPSVARLSAGTWLAATPGGKEILEQSQKLRVGPAEERKAEADATAAEAGAVTAGVTAKFAESKAVQDLRMSEEQIKKWAADTEIAKQNARIAAMNASIARETNQLKREELRMKMEDAVRERDEKLRGKVAEVEKGRTSIDSFIGTADELLSLMVGNDGKPTALIRAASGTLDSILPTVQSDVADLEAKLKTFGDKAFLSKVAEAGTMAGLTEVEGKKLQDSVANLSLKQSPEQLIASIKEAQRQSLKVRKNLALKFGIPDSVPDTPAARPTSAQADEILRELGVIR